MERNDYKAERNYDGDIWDLKSKIGKLYETLNLPNPYKECPRIKEAAILYHAPGSDKWTYSTGKHHGGIFRAMYNRGVVYDKSDYEQGFITTDGRFVDRKEAAEIAYHSNQIKEKKEELFSEDLW